MTHIHELDTLALVAAIGVVVSIVLARVGLPTVAGLLAAGALAGPAGLGLVDSSETIETLAEIGVMFLLFTIGLELSIQRMAVIARHAALAGVTQVGLTIAVTAGVTVLMGRSLALGIFFGFVVALSSTAIVLRALTERRELDAPHGRFIVGALVFQDLCVVPMVLIVPVLGHPGEPIETALSIGRALLTATLVVIGLGLFARLVVPRALRWVDASRSRDVFLLAVLGICIGTAWLTSQVGLSLALGAFLAGVVVADTEFGHRATSEMLPLRDAFVSVFFVSLGMLFDLEVVVARPLDVAFFFAAFVIGNGAIATAVALALRFPARAAWLAGVGLAQFGEFGFVLAQLGGEAGLVDADELAPLSAAGILSMFLTPLLVRLAPHLTAGEKLLAPLERLMGTSTLEEQTGGTEELSDHFVIVGYGVAGRLVTRALDAAGARFIVLELNSETVRRARAAGEPVNYVDATSPEALSHAGIQRARALVLVMNDPNATERVIEAARRVAPQVEVIVRTQYLADTTRLEHLGAHEVVAAEVEAGKEIVARALRRTEDATPRK